MSGEVAPTFDNPLTGRMGGVGTEEPEEEAASSAFEIELNVAESKGRRPRKSCLEALGLLNRSRLPLYAVITLALQVVMYGCIW